MPLQNVLIHATDVQRPFDFCTQAALPTRPPDPHGILVAATGSSAA